MKQIFQHPWLLSTDRMDPNELRLEILKRYSFVKNALNQVKPAPIDATKIPQHGQNPSKASHFEQMMKDQEEFEQLRLQSCDEIATVVNQRIKSSRDLKKIKKEALKNMVESPIIFLQQTATH
jgi:hypothetical protein